MAHGLLDRVAQNPFWFHWLRKLPELNYRETKSRIAAVRDRLGEPRVLDVGCGTGEFAHLFDPQSYLGVDVSDAYVRFAQRRKPQHRFECSDMRAWESAGRTFSLVLVNGILHHLDDTTAREVLGRAVACGAPGSTVLVIEDVELPNAGLGTRLVHRLDEGEHIRSRDVWQELVGGVIPIAESSSYVSGVCPYLLMVCPKP
jgi:trans-aconitate methyltransferase